MSWLDQDLALENVRLAAKMFGLDPERFVIEYADYVAVLIVEGDLESWLLDRLMRVFRAHLPVAIAMATRTAA